MVLYGMVHEDLHINYWDAPVWMPKLQKGRVRLRAKLLAASRGPTAARRPTVGAPGLPWTADAGGLCKRPRQEVWRRTLLLPHVPRCRFLRTW